MDFRRHPLRLEETLTMDYVNRAKKMQEIERRLARDQVIHSTELAAYWVVLGILVTWILLS